VPVLTGFTFRVKLLGKVEEASVKLVPAAAPAVTTTALMPRSFVHNCMSGLLYPSRVSAKHVFSASQLEFHLKELKSLTGLANLRGSEHLEKAQIRFLASMVGDKRLALLHLQETDSVAARGMNSALKLINKSPSMAFAAAYAPTVDELTGNYWMILKQRAVSSNAICVNALRTLNQPDVTTA
jgi:hypothetical protein